jgi:hypothetical protein
MKFLKRGIFIFLVTLWVTAIYSCGTSDDLSDNDDDPLIFTGTTYPIAINTEETILTGNLFYIAPNDVNANINNDGSSAYPWTTLQDVIEYGLIESWEYRDHPYTENGVMILKNPGAPVKGGDTIILRNGFHGEIFLQEYFNADYINVMAEDGHTPGISRLHLQGASRWRFKGLTISPELAVAYYTGSMIFLESHGWRGPVYNVTIDDCVIYSVQNSSPWTDVEWDTLSCNGIQAFGNSITLRNNNLKNVNFGITISGNYALVKSNIIENFAGDGMRGLGNDLFFEYNTVKNCYDVNGNHDDGFQSWSINDDPPRKRVVLRGNVIINYEDPNQPYRGTLQGIGCFDGPYINWVIENNIVMTDHWHGISLYGAFHSRILNNTVIDLNDTSPGPPWIAIVPHKDGTPSKDCLIRNNIATHITVTQGVAEDHNYVIEHFSDYATIFIDPSSYDLHLNGNTPVIDTGSSKLAPTSDIEGNPRPNGAGFDLGAYEYYP